MKMECYLQDENGCDQKRANDRSPNGHSNVLKGLLLQWGNVEGLVLFLPDKYHRKPMTLVTGFSDRIVADKIYAGLIIISDEQPFSPFFCQ